DLRIVAGVDAGQLHFDAVGADRTDDRFGDTELVDAITDDLDRLGEVLLALIIGHILAHAVISDFEGEGDAALEVETELQAALGLLQQVIHEDGVALLDVAQRGLEFDLGEELREVDALLGADLLEGDEDARRLTGGDAP